MLISPQICAHNGIRPTGPLACTVLETLLKFCHCCCTPLIPVLLLLLLSELESQTSHLRARAAKADSNAEALAEAQSALAERDQQLQAAAEEIERLRDLAQVMQGWLLWCLCLANLGLGPLENMCTFCPAAVSAGRHVQHPAYHRRVRCCTRYGTVR
jgi:hypothetical protein